MGSVGDRVGESDNFYIVLYCDLGRFPYKYHFSLYKKVKKNGRARYISPDDYDERNDFFSELDEERWKCINGVKTGKFKNKHVIISLDDYLVTMELKRVVEDRENPENSLHAFSYVIYKKMENVWKEMFEFDDQERVINEYMDSLYDEICEVRRKKDWDLRIS